MQLREYQTKAIESLRYSFNTKGKKSPLLVMPTGSGKTVVFAQISKALETNNKNVLILVHRKELIDQSSKKLKAIGVDHGIIAAKYKSKNSSIQIASVQTLVRRLEKNNFIPNFIIIDEAHHAAAGSWNKILASFPNAYKIGCTATPVRLDGRGLRDYFDDLVTSYSISKLIKLGYLAPFKVYAPPLNLNLDKVKVLAGDYQKKDLEDKMQKANIVGDAVQQYKKHADGLPAIAFCISIKHATDVCNQFKAAGYKSAIVHGAMSTDERDEVIKGLGNGNVQVLTSVDVISEGTDCPNVSCAILLRATKSEGLYLQQVGRILRPQPNKTAIILDHVNATRTHGFVDDNRNWSLDSEKKTRKKGQQAATVETCKKCFACYKPTPKCPVCGYEAQSRERFIKQEQGELEELKRKEQAETEKQQQRILIGSAKTLEELEKVAKILGYKKGWAYKVFHSRKQKTVPRYKASQFSRGQNNRKNASNLNLSKKETIAKIFCLPNSLQSYKMLQQYENGDLHYQLGTQRVLKEGEQKVKIGQEIWETIEQKNIRNDFRWESGIKAAFLQMFAHSWDRAFICNYVKTVKARNIYIDPHSITFK